MNIRGLVDVTEVFNMRKTALIGLAIVTLAAIATGVVTAFAQSTSQPQSNNSSLDPRPGYTYTVVYRQTDGFIVYAVACRPSPELGVYCKPTLQPEQSFIDITNQPVLAQQFFTDWKYDNWHVDLATHQLVRTSPVSSASIAPSLGIWLVGAMVSVSASLGVGAFGTLIWRRTLRRA
ncbi:MAG TPA: hypothetical protein VFE98_05480 [Candidatus Bathyarchaeia archaeon]|nr:hypothetical protein [Candidatus Bathyarchaeia archaeon]